MNLKNIIFNLLIYILFSINTVVSLNISFYFVNFLNFFCATFQFQARGSNRNLFSGLLFKSFNWIKRYFCFIIMCFSSKVDLPVGHWHSIPPSACYLSGRPCLETTKAARGGVNLTVCFGPRL